MKKTACAAAIGLASVVLMACGSGSDSTTNVEATPNSIQLSLLGRYSTGLFAQSAAEIPAFDAASKRGFVVNAQKGELDVLDLSNPAQPTFIGTLSAQTIVPNGQINSVAVKNGFVAVAVQAAVKTDNGKVLIFRASDLSLVSTADVGALPDMLTFSPDAKLIVVANEGEPNDNYSIDPEGSVSIIDVSNINTPVVTTARFNGFNAAVLRGKGVRIYGPNATAAQDLEPEYVTISDDSKTAWVTLQENNAIAKIDLQQKTVLDVIALGNKDHAVTGNSLDVSDSDNKTINIKTWPGLYGMYQPDAIAQYSANGQTYLVTANEGDAREWVTNLDNYNKNADTSLGYVEDIRMKHLFNGNGFVASTNNYPAHLQKITTGVTGALLDPSVFAYCGATASSAGDCRSDAQLGRLNIVWNMGYKTDANGEPLLDLNGKMIYDKLYTHGGRSFSIWDAQGRLIWDSGDAFELKVKELFPLYFNTDHEATAFDNRSDNKGPEPEGVALGKIGSKTFAFIGLERMSGIMVYDISNPLQPKFIQLLTSRDYSVEDPSKTPADLVKAGDLGPEGLLFVPAKDSPNGKAMLIVGNEVSGTTAIYQVN